WVRSYFREDQWYRYISLTSGRNSVDREYLLDAKVGSLFIGKSWHMHHHNDYGSTYPPVAGYWSHISGPAQRDRVSAYWPVDQQTPDSWTKSSGFDATVISMSRWRSEHHSDDGQTWGWVSGHYLAVRY